MRPPSLGSGSACEVAQALKRMRDGRHAIGTQDVTALAALLQVHHANAEIAAPCLVLLSRWARQQTMAGAASPSPALPAPEAAALQAALAPALQILAGDGLANPAGSAAAVFLGNAAAVAPASQRHTIAPALFDAMHRLPGALPPAAAADVISATAALLAAPATISEAACWVLAALLSCLAQLPPTLPHSEAVDAMASLHPAMRGVALEVASFTAQSTTRTPVHSYLEPLYSVLRPVLVTGEQLSAWQSEMQHAAAVLAAGGLLEGLLRSRTLGPPALPLIAALEGHLAAAAATAVHPAVRGACALSTVQVFQAARRPLPSVDSMQCMAGALLDTALSLETLTQLATGAADAPTAAAMLQRQAGGALAQQAVSLLSCAAEHCRLVCTDAARVALQCQVAAAAQRAHEQYRQYMLHTPAALASALDHGVIRQVLDRLFAACITLLAAVWDVATAAITPPRALQSQPVPVALPMQMPAGVAAAVVGVAAALQFCRVQLPQYSELLRAALGALPQDPGAADQLVACLPRYDELEQALPLHGGGPAWVLDAVSAAKVQLLFAALVPCCSSLDAALAESHVAPLAFLYLLHAHPPVAKAAHHVLCALLSFLSAHTCERMAPFYVARSLEGYPQRVPSQQLSQGLATIMTCLPGASPMALVCVSRVGARCVQLAAGGDVASAAQLFGVATQQLFVLHHALVQPATETLEECVQGCPPQVRGALCAAMFEVIAASSDAVRKPTVATRYQRLAARLRAGQVQDQAHSAGM